MASLAEKEKELLDFFSYYIQMEEAHLQNLRSVLLYLKFLYYSEQNDPVMSNPVASYKLIRRLRKEWFTISEYTQQSLYQDYQDMLSEDVHHIPDQEDVDGAALGIIRLQDMYKLYPKDITKDPQTEILLKPDESFHLGKVAYDQDQFQHAFLWFLYTLSNINADQEATVTKLSVLQYLASSAFHFGDLTIAIYFTQTLVHLDPTNMDARLDLAIYKGRHFTQTSNPNVLRLNSTSGSIYEALCRGQTDPEMSRRSRPLSCSYRMGGGDTRLTYAPVKVEEEWDEPSIIRYHDILSESEMEILKILSRPLFESAWLDDYDPVVSRVTQRLAYITGLNMESSETLQVLNYGIGGQFEPHYDTGLSDVGGGGATVFPEIGVSLKPVKGSAVLWYNLLQNGELSELSLHASCPVLQGSKWVAVKWVHERGQEFRRPCSLSKTE
ncbi:prolyl 4-hydroxylase subunit alpha-2 [Electrophorus electricus]|uniref:prolyl 4-hydroxylase subunit alpha-2 n=1 Tax=Electrophorus electricus TaxID=8005 RepID=UPI0015D023F2|nr:prolyl 4-hydroxylase subunit alpha-2 [Electrophorus electricus]